MNRRIAVGWWLLAGMVIACSGTENRLGGVENQRVSSANSSGTGGASGADAGEAPVPQYPAGFGDPGSPHTFAAGTWTGYVENYRSADGSDSVTVEFDALSETAVTGKIILGDASAPVPDYSNPDQYLTGKNFGGAPNDAVPANSYPFTLVDGKLTGSRVQFIVVNDEIWDAWCVQQTPVRDTTILGQYGCIANVQYAYGNNECYVGMVGGPRVDCAQIDLCDYGGPCACNATQCYIQSGEDARFDLSMQDDRMDGSVAGLSSGALNVHLTKM